MKRKHERDSLYEQHSSIVSSNIMEELRKAVRITCIKEGRSEEDAENASQKFLDLWKKKHEELQKIELDKFEKCKRQKVDEQESNVHSKDNNQTKIIDLAVPQLTNLPPSLGSFSGEDWDAEIDSEDDDTEEMLDLYKGDTENKIITIHCPPKETEKAKSSKIEFNSVSGQKKTTTFRRNYSTGFLFLDGREYVFSKCKAILKF